MKAGDASFPGGKTAVASGGDIESQDPVARQKARDGEDDYRMHKGGLESVGSNGFLVTFLTPKK